MPWHARLELDYRLKHGETVLHHRHEGPLRVFQSLYPEGPAICHNVVVHPPGGLANGDVVDIEVQVAEGAHAWIGTPGATRFYRSGGESAQQRVTLAVADGARLEWLPLETLAYSGCEALNSLRLTLAPGAEALLWDVLALGQPSAGKPFEAGCFAQHLELPGLRLSPEGATWLVQWVQASVAALPASVPMAWVLQVCTPLGDALADALAPGALRQWQAWVQTL